MRICFFWFFLTTGVDCVVARIDVSKKFMQLKSFFSQSGGKKSFSSCSMPRRGLFDFAFKTYYVSDEDLQCALYRTLCSGRFQHKLESHNAKSV